MIDWAARRYRERQGLLGVATLDELRQLRGFVRSRRVVDSNEELIEYETLGLDVAEEIEARERGHKWRPFPRPSFLAGDDCPLD